MDNNPQVSEQKVEPVKDRQTVTPSGERVAKLIEGVNIRRLITHPDDRGTLTEVFRESWNFHPDRLQFVKLITTRPGKVKGWVKHLKQDDRIAVCYGTAQFVLYDDREDSPTYKMVNELFFSEVNRSIFVIPAGVYHAVKNVGIVDMVMINLPNNTYNHEDPDKYRLPLQNDLIPYKWRS
jgi:dTDP-4-dehydrorhamnose 3,5-epimerase